MNDHSAPRKRYATVRCAEVYDLGDSSSSILGYILLRRSLGAIESNLMIGELFNPSRVVLMLLVAGVLIWMVIEFLRILRLIGHNVEKIARSLDRMANDSQEDRSDPKPIIRTS